MLLSDVELRAAIDAGRLAFAPELRGAAIQAASIDLTLHNVFWRQRAEEGAGIERIVDPTVARVYDYADRIDAPEIEILPGGFILGETAEGVSLDHGLCGLIEGKSGRARHGLIVHCTAPHIAPGWGMDPPAPGGTTKVANPKRVTLEIVNLGHVKLKLRAGTSIAQLMVMPTGVPASDGYAGRHRTEGT